MQIILALIVMCNLTAWTSSEAEVIGSDDRRVLTENEVKLYAASGKVICDGVALTGQLTRHSNVVTTSGHVFYESIDCTSRIPKRCMFSFTRNGKDWSEVPVDLASLTLGACDSGPKNDWAVMRLSVPISGIEPFKLPDTQPMYRDNDELLQVSGYSQNFIVNGSNPRHVVKCRLRSVVSDSEYSLRTDCDTGGGASGSAQLLLVGEGLQIHALHSGGMKGGSQPSDFTFNYSAQVSEALIAAVENIKSGGSGNIATFQFSPSNTIALASAISFAKYAAMTNTNPETITRSVLASGRIICGTESVAAQVVGEADIVATVADLFQTAQCEPIKRNSCTFVYRDAVGSQRSAKVDLTSLKTPTCETDPMTKPPRWAVLRLTTPVSKDVTPYEVSPDYHYTEGTRLIRVVRSGAGSDGIALCAAIKSEHDSSQTDCGHEPGEEGGALLKRSKTGYVVHSILDSGQTRGQPTAATLLGGSFACAVRQVQSRAAGRSVASVHCDVKDYRFDYDYELKDDQ